MMTNNLAQSVNDFSFGMLFMSQVLFTVIMYHKGRHHSLQRMMFIFMAYLLGISMFEMFFFFLMPYGHGTLTSRFTDILEMTVVPWALLIIIRLTHPQKNLRKVALVNITLYGIVGAAFLITRSDLIYKAILSFTQVYSLYIIIYGFVAVKKFNKFLADNFSDDKLSLYWLKYIVYLYIGIICVWTFATIVADQYSVATYNVCVIFAFGMFCYFVYRQEDMLEVLQAESKRVTDNGNPSAKGLASDDKPQDYHFAEHFEEVFREREIYLNPTLNISDLARELGTNRTYISNYLNQNLHMSFYEYVNQWRVWRAKELLRQTSLSLDDIAAKSGFNSLSSFRRYFVSSVNITPSVYRKQKAANA